MISHYALNDMENVRGSFVIAQLISYGCPVVAQLFLSCSVFILLMWLNSFRVVSQLLLSSSEVALLLWLSYFTVLVARMISSCTQVAQVLISFAQFLSQSFYPVVMTVIKIIASPISHMPNIIWKISTHLSDILTNNTNIFTHSSTYKLFLNKKLLKKLSRLA